ncbi:MAG: alpha/beta hydrolase family protein, partial [Armatimonadota bacterium]
LLHGTADITVPHDQSTRFAEAMQQASREVELVLVDGVPHGFFNQSPHFEATWPAVEAFILNVTHR